MRQLLHRLLHRRPPAPPPTGMAANARAIKAGLDRAPAGLGSRR
jgi:hypothetical protein